MIQKERARPAEDTALRSRVDPRLIPAVVVRVTAQDAVALHLYNVFVEVYPALLILSAGRVVFLTSGDLLMPLHDSSHVQVCCHIAHKALPSAYTAAKVCSPNPKCRIPIRHPIPMFQAIKHELSTYSADGAHNLQSMDCSLHLPPERSAIASGRIISTV
eukprot:6189344-Pleurochrysis_carterae.AAC.3